MKLHHWCVDFLITEEKDLACPTGWGQDCGWLGGEAASGICFTGVTVWVERGVVDSWRQTCMDRGWWAGHKGESDPAKVAGWGFPGCSCGHCECCGKGKRPWWGSSRQVTWGLHASKQAKGNYKDAWSHTRSCWTERLCVGCQHNFSPITWVQSSYTTWHQSQETGCTSVHEALAMQPISLLPMMCQGVITPSTVWMAPSFLLQPLSSPHPSLMSSVLRPCALQHIH